ncbi:MAG: NUDIX hydrolase [Chloroflexi bacterium]|nr:MAG: NUDIX hydrolase [Chloroflexota bacterium]
MRLETIRTICAELGISRATVYRLVQELNLQTYKRRGDRESYVDIDAIQEARQFQPQRPDAAPAVPATILMPAAVPAQPPARTDDGRPIMVAAIIPHPGNEQAVLMTGRVRADERVWSWVGGHVHQGEEPATAVLREVNEELAVQGARVVRLLGTVDTHVDASPYWGRRFSGGYRSFNFLLSVESPDVQVIDHEELSNAEWLPLDRVAEELAPLPNELREPALRFAREAVGVGAASVKKQ